MATLLKHFLLFFFILVAGQTAAQSAVYVYKNIETAEADYMCMRSMPNKEEAEMLTRQKLAELVNDTDKIEKYASTDEKGFGMIIRSTIALPNGKTMSVFGAALGCKSYKQAEALALINLKNFNKEWQQSNYLVVHKFKDK